MKHLNYKYVLALLKSSKSSKELALLLGIAKQYANKLSKRLKEEGETCLSNKNKGKQRKWKTDEKIEDKITALYNNKYNGFILCAF